MNALFLKLLNMSICAGWLALAVLLLRPLLKKAPKWVSVLLWGIVALRLILPISIESALSLIPSAQTIPMDIALSPAPAVDTGVNVLDKALNPIFSQSAPTPGASVNPMQIFVAVGANVWLLGVIAMTLYAALSYLRVRRRVRAAVRLRENIYQSEYVDSPFVLGFFRPRIYLPFRMDEQDMAHVLAHEQAHICRKDHWWKPLGFLLLTLYWFNPLLWLGYILLCRDIELACDEKVIKLLGNHQQADYAQALLSCSIRRRSIAACPLAFGEVGVKERVKSIMKYKKPAFWIIIVAIVICAVVAVCFLTDPVEEDSSQSGSISFQQEDETPSTDADADGKDLQSPTQPEDPASETVIFVAEVLEVQAGFYLVKPGDGWPIEGTDILEVPVQNIAPSPEPQVGDHVIIKSDPTVMEVYPPRLSNPIRITLVSPPDLSLSRMIRFNGKLYTDTGKEGVSKHDTGIAVLLIDSVTEADQIPQDNTQANFGAPMETSFHAGAIENTIEVCIDGSWWIFATEEVWQQIALDDTMK